MKHLLLVFSVIVLSTWVWCHPHRSDDESEPSNDAGARAGDEMDTGDYHFDEPGGDDGDSGDADDDLALDAEALENPLEEKREPAWWSKRRRRCATTCSNPCKSAVCPKYPGAVCSPDCCKTKWRIWKIARDLNCECTKPIVRCAKHPCLTAKCLKKPKAKCLANYCGGCNYEFFYSDKKVEECSSEYVPRDFIADGMQPRFDEERRGGESGAMSDVAASDEAINEDVVGMEVHSDPAEDGDEDNGNDFADERQ